MKTHRIGVRVSAELHALLAAAGDVSATTRALAILGAAAVGYELGALRDEAATLLAAPLDPLLRAALWSLISERSTPVPQMLDTCSTLVPQTLNILTALASTEPAPNMLLPDTPSLTSDADPLTTIGFEV